MKIAVTYENGMVFGHFGQTEQFKFYEVEDNKVIKEEIVDTNGVSHSALVGFLKERGVDVLICGGLGMHGRDLLAEVGIEFYPGVEGNADDAVNDLLHGDLVFNMDALCNHHGHHDGGCGHNH